MLFSFGALGNGLVGREKELQIFGIFGMPKVVIPWVSPG